MTKAELIQQLNQLAVESDRGDTEVAHRTADILVLEWINDEEIEAAYDAIEKWYA